MAFFSLLCTQCNAPLETSVALTASYEQQYRGCMTSQIQLIICTCISHRKSCLYTAVVPIGVHRLLLSMDEWQSYLCGQHMSLSLSFSPAHLLSNQSLFTDTLMLPYKLFSSLQTFVLVFGFLIFFPFYIFKETHELTGSFKVYLQNQRNTTNLQEKYNS